MSRFSANTTVKTVARTRPRLAAVAAGPDSPKPSPGPGSGGHPLARLHRAIEASHAADPAVSRTARLLAGGRTKIAKKLCEEATEVALETVKGRRGEVIEESADLLYHLAIIWSAVGIAPDEIWAEMERREALFGIAEKRRKPRGPRAGPA